MGGPNYGPGRKPRFRNFFEKKEKKAFEKQKVEPIFEDKTMIKVISGV